MTNVFATPNTRLPSQKEKVETEATETAKQFTYINCQCLLHELETCILRRNTSIFSIHNQNAEIKNENRQLDGRKTAFAAFCRFVRVMIRPSNTFSGRKDSIRMND